MKKVAFVLPKMCGGGAERVASLIANELFRRGADVRFLLTQARREEVIRQDLSEDIPLVLLSEMISPPTAGEKIGSRMTELTSNVLCKPFEALQKPVPASFAKLSLKSQYDRQIRCLRELLIAEPDLNVITFLQPSIPITLLAAVGLPNRVIISERANPERLMKKRYGKKFVETYYRRADAAVFQTADAMRAYPECIAAKGVVIPNPLKPGLPQPYTGERRKVVTTFCRISAQKNLPLLTDAFRLLYRDHPDYRLRIIGDTLNEEGEQVKATLLRMIADEHLEDSVQLEPFSTTVHQEIVQDAMYVNSSDYEGISNAMLEAMAIGMPSVCTDCPIGGARATITDGENGLLVPVGDADALYRAMKRIVEDDALSKRLSQGAVRLRDELSLTKISEKWMKLI